MKILMFKHYNYERIYLGILVQFRKFPALVWGILNLWEHCPEPPYIGRVKQSLLLHTRILILNLPHW